MYYSPTEAMEEAKSNSDSEDEVLIYPYPDEHCSRTFPVPDTYRMRVRKRKKSGGHPNLASQPTGNGGTMSTSLSSPISILASPVGLNGGGSGSLHSSGPLSAPATFSWGAQSPIPPRGSPGVVVVPTPTSPYLLSPGRDQFPPTSLSAAAPALTSSPLLPPPPPVSVGQRGSPLLPTMQPPTSLSRSSPLIGNPVVTSCSFLPATCNPTSGGHLFTGSEGGVGVALSVSVPSTSIADPCITKTGIPVGIAVARQRHKETAAVTATVSGQLQQVKDHPAPAVPIPSWPFPLLSAPHSHSPTAGTAAPLTSPLLHPGATLPPPSIPLQDYGRYLTSAALGNAAGSSSAGSSGTSQPTVGSAGTSAFSPIAAAAAASYQPSAAAAAQSQPAAASPFWSPFSSYYPFLLHSAAAYHHHQQQSAAAAATMAAPQLPTASLTALQAYHQQLLLLHAQQSLYSGDKGLGMGVLDPYSSLHHRTPVQTGTALGKEEARHIISPQDDSGLGISVDSSSRLDHSSLSSRGRHESASSSRGRHESAASSLGRHDSGSSLLRQNMDQSGAATLLRPCASMPMLPLDFTTSSQTAFVNTASVSGLRGFDSPSALDASAVLKSPKIDRSRSATPLNRSGTPTSGYSRSLTPSNRPITPSTNRSSTPLLNIRSRTPLDIKHFIGTPPAGSSLNSTHASLTCTPISGSTSGHSTSGGNLTSTPLIGSSGVKTEEKKGDRSSEDDNISVGTESIEANTTTKHETPNDDRTTPSGLIVSPSAPGGFATTSNTAFTPVVSGGGVVLVQPPVSSDGVVMVQPKKMWQCKVEAENNSHQPVIGKPSKIRCVDQKFLSGERLPEHQPVALGLPVHQPVALGFSAPSIHNLEDNIAEPSDLELVSHKSAKDPPQECHAVHITAEQQGITNKKEQIDGGGDENGLHLLYEGIQKQLSRRPSADLQKQDGAHQPLDETTGEFILKEEKEESLSRDLYLANQLIHFATENLQQHQKRGKIVVRHTSVDSPLSRHLQDIETGFDGVEDGGRSDLLRTPRKGTLGLLCDVASEIKAEEDGIAGLAQLRLARSRSDETERNIRRTSPASKQNIREFIERRSSRSSEGHSPGRLSAGSPFKSGTSPYRATNGTSPYRYSGSPVKGMDLDEMEAWEISMRLDMADIQKKYREKYRELYMLESRKDRKKPPPPAYKRSSSDHKNSNGRSASATTTPTKSPKSRKNSIEAMATVQAAIENACTAENVENNNSPLSSPASKADSRPVTTPSPPTVSSFDETFAKFKKSYLGNRFKQNVVGGNNNPMGSGGISSDSRLSATPVSSSVLRVKIDRPTPFANLLRLSSTNGGEPLSPGIIKPEPKEHEFPPTDNDMKQDDNDVLINGDHAHKPEVAKVFKRKNNQSQRSDEYGNESPVYDATIEYMHPKKKPKYEKYIISSKSYEAKITSDDDVFSRSEERRRSKKKEHKKHKDKSHHHRSKSSSHHHYSDQENSYAHRETNSRDENLVEYRVKKHKRMKLHHYSDIPADNQISNCYHLEDRKDLVKVKSEYSEENEDCDIKSYKEHKKDKKRDKEKKKKRSKDKKRQKVRVRDGGNDYVVMEIMDRTPTPSSGRSIKQEPGTTAANVKIEIEEDENDHRDDVKEEPVEYDWSDIEALMKTSELTETKLRDGQRILTRVGGHFYPGRITEISPPDIYGILVDRERGNKPHICSREEVLSKAILEVSPGRVAALQPGARVCAYWSSKYHYLHPGTVVENTQGLNLPRDYVVIELDDGDSRDFHIDSIRYLPPSYPLVVGESDPLNGLGLVRRRRTSSIESSPSKPSKSDKPEKKSGDKKSEKSTKKPREHWKSEIITTNLKIRIRSPESDGCGVAVKQEDGPPVLTPQNTSPSGDRSSNEHPRLCPKLEPGMGRNSPDNNRLQLPPGAGELPNHPPTRDDDQDSAFESNGRGEEDDELCDEDIEVDYQRRRMPSNDKSKIRAFLPPQHILWAWGDKGIKPKNKTRKIFHTQISRGDEVIRVGDSAVFLSTSRPDRPYIGKIEDMWESWSGNMKVRVRWFYHAEEAEGTGKGGRRAIDLRLPGALFESSHFDENDIQTISHKCDVVPVQEFAARLACTPGLKEAIYENNELYYTAGTYDPVVGTLTFHQNVFNI